MALLLALRDWLTETCRTPNLALEVLMDAETRLDRAQVILARLRSAGSGDPTGVPDHELDALAEELVQAREAVSSLQRKVDGLAAENRRLRAVGDSDADQPVATRAGCYQFAHDDTLYCAYCWDNRREKARTTRITARHRVCSVCRSPLS